MKQRYTLTIAGTEIDIVTEESKESVENVVNTLDRKMREIMLKSRTCPKNNAALLCAMEFCSDKLALSEQNRQLTKELDAAERNASSLDAKISELNAELERLRDENRRLTGVISPEPEIKEEAPAAEPAPDAEAERKPRRQLGPIADLLKFSDI